MIFRLKNVINAKSGIIFLYLFLLISLSCFAQKLSVKGIIHDADGNKVSNVFINEKGTQLAALSNQNGEFHFTPTAQYATLIFSKEGFKDTSVVVIDTTLLKIILYPAAKKTVKLSYKYNTDSNLASAIFMADYLDLRNDVMVFPESQQPSSLFVPILKGTESFFSKQPLYIVDGIVMNGGINLPQVFGTIDPLTAVPVTSIGKVEILKDISSAAIYGSMGANGVVLINTKTPESGNHIHYQGQAGIYTPLNAHVTLDPNAYKILMNESFTAAGIPPAEEMTSESNKWFENAVRPIAFTDHTVSYDSSVKKVKLGLSANFGTVPGVVEESSYLKGNFSGNIAIQASQWLNIAAFAAYHQSTQTSPLHYDNRYSQNPLVYAHSFPPVLMEGVLTPEKFSETQEAQNTMAGFRGNFALTIHIFDNLVLNSSVSGNYSDFGQDYWSIFAGENFQQLDVMLKKHLTGNVYNWQFKNYLEWIIEGKKNKLKLAAGSDGYYFKSESFTGFEFLSQSDELTYTNSKGMNSRRVSALYSSLYLNLNNRFDFSGVFRRESLFRQNGENLYGLTPGAEARLWIVKPKAAFSGLSSFNLKASWGVAGADNLHYLNMPAQIGLPEGTVPLVVNALLPNARWETTEEWVAGFSSQWFESSLTIGAGYFDRLRDHVAFPVLNPSAVNSWNTEGRVYNSGLDVFADYRKNFSELFLWAGFHLQSSASKVLETGNENSQSLLYSVLPGNENLPVAVMKQGEAPNSFWGYRFEKIFSSDAEVEAANELTPASDIYYQNIKTRAGDIKFADIDNNGYIDENDMTVIGSPNPAYWFNFSFGAAFKGFDIAGNFDGMGGNEILNNNLIWANASGGLGNRSDEMINRWNEQVPSTVLPRLVFDDPNNNNRIHSGMVEDGSFFRMAKLEVGYQLPEVNNSKIRLFMLATNLFSTAKKSLDDPFSGSSNAAYPGLGINYGRYPSSRSFSIGAQIGF